MFRGQYKIRNNLTIEITLQIIADNLFLSVGRIREYIFTIAYIQIVKLVPKESLECAGRINWAFFKNLYALL